MNNKMNASVVPEEFTLSLAIVDMIPVLFFGLAAVRIGIALNSLVVEIGAVVVFISGALKAIWKLIVVLKKKNIWWMFIQMRIAMPAGFVLMVLGAIFNTASGSVKALAGSMFSQPSISFTVIGIAGMVCMIIFAIILDSADTKSNWIEQSINGLSQICFFIALMLIR